MPARSSRDGTALVMHPPPADWEPVATEERDGTPLVADRAEPIRALIELTPVSITPREDGTSIVDLGQNMTGWARLRARGPAGTTIRLRFSEVLNPDGGIYIDNLRSAHQTDTFVLAGLSGTGGDEVYRATLYLSWLPLCRGDAAIRAS